MRNTIFIVFLTIVTGSAPLQPSTVLSKQWPEAVLAELFPNICDRCFQSFLHGTTATHISSTALFPSIKCLLTLHRDIGSCAVLFPIRIFSLLGGRVPNIPPKGEDDIGKGTSETSGQVTRGTLGCLDPGSFQSLTMTREMKEIEIIRQNKPWDNARDTKIYMTQQRSTWHTAQ